jgi:hypothetical protein
MISPKWSPEIRLGDIVYAVVVACGGIGVLVTGIWFAFSFAAEMKAQVAGQAAEFNRRIEVQDGKMALLQQQLALSTEWRAEVRDQLKGLNEKLEAGNKALVAIQLGLANKVDRKP